jgi:predicted GNAT superfamily acetyltransferase
VAAVEATTQEAVATAVAAAEAAGVHVVPLDTPSAMREVAALFDEVWGRDPAAGTILAAEALTALVHAGGQVSAALRGDELVGATAAFIGLAADGEIFLHSHVTGVTSRAAGSGVGRALKWHQRAWALQRGIGRVRWTFDPLIRRNAVLNLLVLGAHAVAYREDLYGRMHDARNAGGPTDRLVADWDLTAPRVRAAATGRAAAPDVEALRRAGAVELLRVDPAGAPLLTPTDERRQLVQVPEDIERLRRRDADLAAAWGAAVRATLGDRVQAGYRVSGFTRDGWYVLTADRATEELAQRR